MSQGVNQGKEPGLWEAVCCALEAQLEGTLCWAVSCRTRQAQLSAVWDSILKVWWTCMVCMAVVAAGCGNNASAGGAQQVRTALQVRWVVRGKGASGVHDASWVKALWDAGCSAAWSGHSGSLLMLTVVCGELL